MIVKKPKNLYFTVYSSKYHTRVYVPKDLQEVLGLKAGDYVVYRKLRSKFYIKTTATKEDEGSVKVHKHQYAGLLIDAKYVIQSGLEPGKYQVIQGGEWHELRKKVKE